MKSILRRLRGALGTAVTWAVAWAVGGFAVAAILFFLGPGFGGIDSPDFRDVASIFTVLGGVAGLVGGTVFSIALGTVHRRRQLRQLSSVRMGLWGALAGLLVPLGVVGVGIGMGTVHSILLSAEVLGTTIVLFGGGGAATAVATVKLAQAAERGDRETRIWRRLLLRGNESNSPSHTD
jgi:hypothetical protein